MNFLAVLPLFASGTPFSPRIFMCIQSSPLNLEVQSEIVLKLISLIFKLLCNMDLSHSIICYLSYGVRMLFSSQPAVSVVQELFSFKLTPFMRANVIKYEFTA
jgi:hypothetical protein